MICDLEIVYQPSLGKRLLNSGIGKRDFSLKGQGVTGMEKQFAAAISQEWTGQRVKVLH